MSQDFTDSPRKYGPLKFSEIFSEVTLNITELAMDIRAGTLNFDFQQFEGRRS